MIDVHRLRVLHEVAQHGSFNRAATALRCTPSAVSQQIAALERTLGTPVVQRSTRGVTLTASGRLLVEAAENITAELDHARARIDRLTSGSVRFTVATFASGGRRLLPPALTEVCAAHPEVELTILEREPEDSLPLVRSGRADVALAYHFDGPPPGRGERSGLIWTPLAEDPLWLVLPAGHKYADAPAVHLADLAAERWVLGCLKTADLLQRYATLAGFELRVSCSATDYFFAASLVAAGVGVSLIPQVALDQLPPGLAVVPLEAPRPARHIGVAVARRADRPAQAYLDTLTRALFTGSPESFAWNVRR
ncbi:molybdate transport repressor ModE-like protein [Hamadaea flava]|uniref:LysR family transcriptional regulator n=1 Tax=Hamadaea flava TaxID=1742688 RepID=A0ABV8LQM8_9ACTN|nr:LysR family transcriptional regulator [Hamadaea flava]MCP2322849.1 molybdate transport repressor ModE-like protein [Hamadaea flava]